MKAEMEEIKPNKIFIAAKSRSQIKCWTGGHLCNIILMLLSILSSYNTTFIQKNIQILFLFGSLGMFYLPPVQNWNEMVNNFPLLTEASANYSSINNVCV